MTPSAIERMNCTIKPAPVKCFHYGGHKQIRTHLKSFFDAYNFGCHLKALRGLAPYELICEQRTSEPKRFILNPLLDVGNNQPTTDLLGSFL